MITLEELNKNWDNLPEPIKIDILGYITALLNDTKKVPEDIKAELEKRLAEFNEQDSEKWINIYNKLLEELI